MFDNLSSKLTGVFDGLRKRGTLSEADVSDALRDAGFDADEIWDIGAIAAFFGMSNRMANAGDFRANDEFYMLGRT